nr:putative integron gene cassette protein [uncultured bacterium]
MPLKCASQREKENTWQKLICPSGKTAKFQRAGSIGPRHDLPEGLTDKQLEELLLNGFEALEVGAIDYHIIDAYTVGCGSSSTTVYLDMYHCDKPAPEQSPKGFLGR